MTESLAPSAADATLARKASRRLAAHGKRKLKLQLREDRGRGEFIDLPAAAAQLLVRLLAEMAAGHAVALLPVETELTTQQAADILGVSRPFLIKQVRSGKLACRKVGTHRRIAFGEVLRYKHATDAARRMTLDKLAAQAQELDMGY